MVTHGAVELEISRGVCGKFDRFALAALDDFGAHIVACDAQVVSAAAIFIRNLDLVAFVDREIALGEEHA